MIDALVSFIITTNIISYDLLPITMPIHNDPSDSIMHIVFLKVLIVLIAKEKKKACQLMVSTFFLLNLFILFYCILLFSFSGILF
jgi:hypothetical protein